MRDYPQPLRRIRYHDVQTSKTFNFLTNNFAIPAQTVTDLYRYRRQPERRHFRATRNGERPISGANNGATAIAFGGPRSSRRALRAAPGLPQ